MADTFTSKTSAPVGPALGNNPAGSAAASSAVALSSGVTSSSSSEGQFTSRVSAFNADVFGRQADLEKVVRPFESFKERRDQRLEQLRNPPGTEDETATLCWGKAPALPQSTTKPEEGGTRIINRKANEEPEDPDNSGREFTFNESERKTRKIKVASENDPEVYVMVERIDTWIANGSDGVRYKFEFKNDRN